MAEQPLNDPNLAQLPDYASPRFDVLREALVQGGRTIEEAIQLLETAWLAENEHLRQRWAEQQERNQQALTPPPQQAPEEDIQPVPEHQDPPPRPNNPHTPERPPAAQSPPNIKSIP